MPFARPNLTRPFPRPAKPRPKRAIQIAGGSSTLAAFAEESGTWNFAVRVWIAFDAPTATAPAWIPVTGYIETEKAITITNHGRADGIADVNATTLSLTADNSDGRWCASNPSGAWYGLIHKGCWIKVEILPPSGIVSQRFVGFITSLPTAWTGQYASSQITASDRFEKLGNAPALISSIQSEVLTDPNLAAGNSSGSAVKAYWNLHEASGSLTFGDTSGNGGPHLYAAAAGGVLLGTGFGASNVAGPGFDGLRAVTFNPSSNTQGTYLTGPVTAGALSVATGPSGTLEFWFQATTTGVQQFIAGIVDPIAQLGFSFYIDASGQLEGWLTSTAPTGTWAGSGRAFGPRVDDGRWHHFIVSGGQDNSGGGVFQSALDGVYYGYGVGGANSFLFTPRQIYIGAAYDPSSGGTLRVGAANIAEVAWSWAVMAGGFITYSTARPPNIADHYAAGATGFLGESTDSRVARIARYAGVPIPLALANDTAGFGRVQVYNPTKGPWTNLSAGAHTCGTQSVSGRKALDVMREAARTEAMPLFVNGSGYLTMQASTIRQNTSPAWTVDSRDLEDSTEMPDDFAYTVNQVTVTPNSQAAQTVIGTVGTASQAKYGQYDKSQATASVSPVEARSLGLSYIQLGADPPPRLAPLVVEVATLATQAGYGAAWYDAILATEISTAARVTNLPAQAGGGSYDALIEGWTETILAGTHMFAFATSPVQGPTYQLDDAVLGRADTDGSTLTTGIGTADTTMTVATTGQATGSPLWVTDGLQFPFDVKVDGEQMTVTSISSLFGNGATIADGTFESGVANWTPSASCTVTSTSADKYAGTKSALLASTAFVAIQLFCPNTAVTAASTYLLNMWVKFASGSVPSAYVNLIWFNSSFTQIGTSNGTITTLGAGWTNITGTFTAPAGAAWAQFGPTSNSASSGSSFYVDNIVFQLTTGPQQFAMTRSVNGVVASHSAGAAVSLWSPTTLAY